MSAFNGADYETAYDEFNEAAYLYKLDEVDDNHEAYTGDGDVRASSAVSKAMPKPVKAV